MRPRALLFTAFAALSVSLLFHAPADAGIHPRGSGGSLFAGQGSIVIPAEWAGIWTYVDSTYDCSGPFQSRDTGSDTLCAGKVIDFNEGSPFTVDCTGTTTATTVDVTCTYSGEVFTDCNVSFTIVTQGTRTVDSYVITSTITTVYSGTGAGCDFFPDSCTRTVTRATRTAPEPAEYCATPTLPSTWGRVKSRYH